MTKPRFSFALAALATLSLVSFVDVVGDPSPQGATVSVPAAPTASDASTAPTSPASSTELAKALAYTVPPSECKPPRFPRRGGNFRGEADSLNKLHSYIECLNVRSTRLKADFEFLRNSVRSGATKTQADVVGGNLRAVYLELHQLQALAKQAEEAEVASAGPGVYRNPELAR